MKALSGRFQNESGFWRSSIPTVATVFLTACLTGCLTEGTGSEDATNVVGEPGTVRPPLTTPERTVCDPFSAGTSAQDHGLVGLLVYLTDDLPRYTNVSDYIDNGTPVQSTLYFDKLFVPTRKFDLGFYTQDGRLILNQHEEPLYEYFALRLESELMLASGESPGYYQLALLSDDGARISRKNSDGSLTLLVDNDGTHPTRFGCGGPALYLDENSRIPVVLEYYQGPRYHISLIAMWRPVPDGVDPSLAVSDAQCGRSGNAMYFDYTQVPSVPTATYYNLLTRGWKPLTNENYYFPEQASNPCAQEDPLLISNFALTNITRTSVTLSWTTNLPSTTKVSTKNVTTGQVTESSENTTLTTSHSVTLTGLSANTLYAVKGISTTSGGQTVMSDEGAFRTPR
ncbi:MAG: fibronectin type III domain-containing protein [Bdellovibrionales bacterium]